MKQPHRISIFLLCCLLLLSLFPTPAFASTSLVSEEEGALLIPFQKNWDDADAKDSRPSGISVSLYKYSTDTFVPESAVLIQQKTITAAESWSCVFDISGELLFDQSGKAYQFKIVEESVPNYAESEHVDPAVSFTLPDANNGWNRITPCSELDIQTEGLQKSAVVAKKGNTYVIWTFEALSAGERKALFDSAAENILGFGQGNFENATFISGFGNSASGLTVTEDKISFDNPKDWSFFATGLYSKSSATANASHITNRYVETCSVSGYKIWDDAKNQDGKRPQSITVSLLKNGVPVQSKVVTADDQWAWSFDNLAKYEDDQEIVYTIEEAPVADYTADYDVTEEGYLIINTHQPEKVSVSVKKVWEDADNQDHIRPKEITVQLLANGSPIAGQQLKLSSSNQWEDMFTDLPKYQDGEQILYTVSEMEVEGYSSSVKGDMQSGFVITNVHTPEKQPDSEVPQPDSEVPQLGDSSQLLMWAGLFLVCCGCLFGLIRYKRKHLQG